MAKRGHAHVPETATIREGRAWLRPLLNKGGGNCPLCLQRAVVRKRSLNAGMVKDLVAIYRISGGDTSIFVHRPLRQGEGHEANRLHYWQLVQREKDAIGFTDGRQGWYRITAEGVEFVLGRTLVPKYALEYGGVQLGLEKPMIDVHEALTNKFNLADLLSDSHRP